MDTRGFLEPASGRRARVQLRSSRSQVSNERHRLLIYTLVVPTLKIRSSIHIQAFPLFSIQLRQEKLSTIYYDTRACDCGEEPNWICQCVNVSVLAIS